MAKQQWLPSSQAAWPSRCPSLLLCKGKGRGRQGTGEDPGEQRWALSVGAGWWDEGALCPVGGAKPTLGDGWGLCKKLCLGTGFQFESLCYQVHMPDAQ